VIAPIRDHDSTTSVLRRRLRRARLAAASTLLHVEPSADPHTKPMVAWKAWLVSAWMLTVVVVYALHMARWW